MDEDPLSLSLSAASLSVNQETTQIPLNRYARIDQVILSGMSKQRDDGCPFDGFGRLFIARDQSRVSIEIHLLLSLSLCCLPEIVTDQVLRS